MYVRTPFWHAFFEPRNSQPKAKATKQTMSDVDPSGRNAGDDAPSEAPSSNAGDNAPFDAMAFMSNFDPGLIHRVLLTEPSDYSNLTMSGQPRLDRTPAFDANFLYDNGFADTTTPTLGEGVDGNEPNVSSQISRTMKKAFHDALVASLLQAATRAEGAREEGPEQDSPPPNTSDLSAIIIDLHEKMRQMIPNRTDLHGTLSDEEVKSIQLGGRDVLSAYLPHLIRSAEALIQLESEDRSVTTRQWLEMASSAVAAVSSPPALPLDIPSPEIFVVSSLSYLHLKPTSADQTLPTITSRRSWLLKLLSMGRNTNASCSSSALVLSGKKVRRP